MVIVMSDFDHNSDREEQICNILFAMGEQRLPDLAKRLDVSLATLRRDLTSLSAQGRVSRSHGAARIADSSAKELGFGLREQINLPAKRAIAAAAFQVIEDGETLFLDAGTTVLQLARYLRLHPRPLRVLTNGLAIATELAHVPSVTVSMIGGRLRPENMSMVGPGTAEALGLLWADRLFLGASAISAGGKISSFDQDEAHVNATMIRRAARCHVLADQSKLNSRQTFHVATLAKGIELITDARLPRAALDALTAAGAGVRGVSVLEQIA